MIRINRNGPISLSSKPATLLRVPRAATPLFLMPTHLEREPLSPESLRQRELFRTLHTSLSSEPETRIVFLRQGERDRAEAELDRLLLGKERKPRKRKWVDFTFGPELLPLQPFDLHPVTDIVIRQAVETGVRNRRELALYKTTEEWNGYPKDTIVLAAKLEEGQLFSVWDPPKRKKKGKGEEQESLEEE